MAKGEADCVCAAAGAAQQAPVPLVVPVVAQATGLTGGIGIELVKLKFGVDGRGRPDRESSGPGD